MENRISFPAACRTTAMGIMPPDRTFEVQTDALHRPCFLHPGPGRKNTCDKIPLRTRNICAILLYKVSLPISQSDLPVPTRPAQHTFAKMQNEPLAHTNRRLKRKSGGQKGNQNARKHGFYSRALSPDEIGEFWNIVNLERVDPEVALVRLKLKSLLQHDPLNRRVLRTASGLLAKWYRAKYGLGRPDGNNLKAVIRSILAQLPGASPSEPVGPAAATADSDKTNRAYFNNRIGRR
jgi:hypothetical protein